MKPYQNYMFALFKVPDRYPSDYTTFRTNSYGSLSVEMYFFNYGQMLSVKISALLTAKGDYKATNSLDLSLYSEHPSTCYIDYADLEIARVDDIFDYYLGKKSRSNGQRLINLNSKFEVGIEDFVRETNCKLNEYLDVHFIKQFKIKNAKNKKIILPKFNDEICSKLKKTLNRSFNKVIKFINLKPTDKYRFQFGDGSFRVMQELISDSKRALFKKELSSELTVGCKHQKIQKI